MFGTNAFGEYAFGEQAQALPPPSNSTVTGVTVTPSSASVPGGATFDFNWQVLGTNSPSQAVMLSTSLGLIDTNGLLTAPAATQVDQSGTVTVTSTQDPTQKGYAYFTVPAAGAVDPTTLPTFPISTIMQETGLLNVGEYGINLCVNVNYGLAGFTSLEVDITCPDGSKIVRTNANANVSIGQVNLVTAMGNFAAFQYVQYPIQNGDLTLPGTYFVRVIYTDSTKRLVSDITTFEVQS